MKLAGIAVVRNEQDIIEPFVRHNLRFLDTLTVMDNGSVDATKDILAALAAELPGLAIQHDDGFADALSDRATALLRSHAPIADYVVPLDADEFLTAATRADFEQQLAAIPVGGYGVTPWRTVVLGAPAPALSNPAPDPPRTLPLIRTQESPQFSKVIVRTAQRSAPDLVLLTGAHEVLSSASRPLAAVHLSQPLLHVPVRSCDQLVGKACISWMAYLAHNPNARATSENYHKREVFDLVMSNGSSLSEHVLARLSMLYAQDARPIDWGTDLAPVPVAWDYTRRYSTGRPMPPMQLVLRSWEKWVAAR